MPAATLPDLAAIRSQFPALATGFAYLENAGGSQVPAGVPDAMRDYMRSAYVQIGAPYEASRETWRLVAAAHDWGNRLVGGEAVGSCILGASSTALVRVLAQAWGTRLGPGDAVVLAETGHEANIGPWAKLERQGVEVRWWRVDPETFECPIDQLRDLLADGRARLVAFPHVSNLLGQIVDVAEATRIAHGFGAQVVVDGVAYAPHAPMDVEAWGVDWYLFSAYKVYGPHMAAMFGRREAWAALDGVNHFFIGPSSFPSNFEPGGVSFEACAGLVALQPYLQFLAGGDPTEPASRETVVAAFSRMFELEGLATARLLGGLQERSDRFRVVGSPEPGPRRVGTVSFLHRVQGVGRFAERAGELGVGIRTGHAYAYRLVEALGIDPETGVIRASCVHYNSPEEVDRLIACLDARDG